ncbi:MAG: GspE/PulE family protein [bacterium]
MFLPQVSSEEIKEKFHDKIKKIKDEELEKYTNEKASVLGLQYIDLIQFPISPDAISVIEEEQAIQTGVVCFFYNREEFRIGFYNENNFDQVNELLKKLKMKLRANGELYFISENSFLKALKVYKAIPKIKKPSLGVKISGEDISRFKEDVNDFRKLEDKIKDVSLTDLMTLIIASALQARSSDIHIEAEEQDVKVRFRIDGILHDTAGIEKEKWPKLIARIKLISKLKLNIENKPQDGRFTIFLTEGNIDVRVSTLPTAFGESVVMRLLTSGAQGLTFKKLGLRKKAFNDLSREIKKPNGMIITTGPTGSGKTTTLYSCVKELNSPDIKIITLEDPIEYKLSGINQSQIDAAKGYTFAKGLRSILRQDPDVVMVGEIRDDETADIAINAALTGHLVISTIHTNSASGAIPRFLALNAKPYLLTPALNVIIGQRLIRRICTHCKKECEISEDEKEEVKKALAEIPKNSEESIPCDFIANLKFYKGEGCEKCQNLGYMGRIGIYEVMVVDEEIKLCILEAKDISEYNIQKIAQKNGMITMRQDGILKAMEGITSLEEVFRATK